MRSGIRPCRRSPGMENGSTGSLVAAPGGREWGPSLNVQGTRIWKPGQPETLLFVSSPYSSDSFSFIRFEGGGVSGNAWRRHPSRSFPGNWDGGTRTSPPGNKTEPVQGTRLREVHGHKAPSGLSTIINW